MTEQVFETTQQAVEAYQDGQAGIEHVPAEKESRPVYENVEQALTAINKRAEDRAEVERHIDLTSASDQNTQNRDSAFELGGDHKQQVEQFRRAAHAVAAERQAYQKVMSSIDLEKLRKEKPGEYANLKLEIKEFEQKLSTKQSQLLQAAGIIQANIAGGVLEKERSKLLKAAPEMADASVQQEVRDYLLRNGATQAEIEGVYDHRAVLNAYRAMQYEKSKVAKKKKIPKIQKRAKQELNSEVKRLKKKFLQTRGLSAAADYYAASQKSTGLLSKSSNKQLKSSATHSSPPVRSRRSGPLSFQSALELIS